MVHNLGMGEMKERPWREWRARGVFAVGLGAVFTLFAAFSESREWWESAGTVAIPVGVLALGVALARWSWERRRAARSDMEELAAPTPSERRSPYEPRHEGRSWREECIIAAILIAVGTSDTWDQWHAEGGPSWTTFGFIPLAAGLVMLAAALKLRSGRQRAAGQPKGMD